MQSRWARFFSTVVCGADPGGARKGLCVAGVCAAAALASSVAWATVTVSSLYSGAAGYGSNVTPATAYWGVANVAGVTTLRDTNDQNGIPPLINFNTSQTTSATDQDAAEIILNSDVANTPQTNGRFAWMVFANVGGTQRPVPIGWVNTAPGTGAPANCQSQGVAGGGFCEFTLYASNGANYYYGVDYTPGTAIEIGLLPADICIAQPTAAAPFCTNNTATPLAAGATTTIALTFELASLPSTGWPAGFIPGQVTNTAPTGVQFVDQISYSYTFQAGGPTGMTCTQQNSPNFNLNFLYTPGDGQIFLNTTNFALSGDIGGDTQAVLVIPFNQATQRDANNFPTVTGTPPVNAFRVPIGSINQPVAGLQDSGPNGQFYYNMDFYARDFAGYVASNATASTSGPANGTPPITASQCALPNVQVASIQGALSSNHCFIATAAFREQDAPAITLLRHFRDRILLHNRAGQAFVSWYYRNSPPAAEWLIDHPRFRYPVLLLLLPLEALAWACLHPGALLALVLLDLAAIAWVWRKLLGADALRARYGGRESAG